MQALTLKLVNNNNNNNNSLFILGNNVQLESTQK